MNSECTLRHDHLQQMLEHAIAADYTFLTCAKYAATRPVDQRVCVLRHDIDALPERAPAIAAIEAGLGIQASYFFRVHANEYNAFGHETLAIMRDLLAQGHEIGLHAEPLDLRASCGVDPAVAIRASVAALREVLGVPIVGVASHNDVTPDNNLDFFRQTPASRLGLLYEAYDDDGLDLFGRSWYVTDGYFWHWRAFHDGELTDNRDCLCKHIAAGHSPLYALVHPHVWYREHFHRVRY